MIKPHRQPSPVFHCGILLRLLDWLFLTGSIKSACPAPVLAPKYPIINPLVSKYVVVVSSQFFVIVFKRSASNFILNLFKTVLEFYIVSSLFYVVLSSPCVRNLRLTSQDRLYFESLSQVAVFRTMTTATTAKSKHNYSFCDVCVRNNSQFPSSISDATALLVAVSTGILTISLILLLLF